MLGACLFSFYGNTVMAVAELPICTCRASVEGLESLPSISWTPDDVAVFQMRSYHTGKQLGECGLIYACERGTNQSKHSRCLIHCFRHMGLELLVTVDCDAEIFYHWLFQVWCHSCNTPSLGLLYRGVVICICPCWIPSAISGTRSEGCLSPLELWFGHQGMIILGTAWWHPQIFLRYTPVRHWLYDKQDWT